MLSNITADYTIPSPDALLFDANAIFYGVQRKLFDKNPLSTHTDLCKAISLELLRLIKRVNPNKTVYIAIDGVAGLSKQSQQRKRRFMSVRARNEQEDQMVQDESDRDYQTPRFKKAPFDTINFTAGTSFMAQLCLYIREFFSKLSYLTVTVLIDDMYNPGEGEHKLMHFIRKDQSHHTYMVMSPDADLIMLILGLRKPNVFILRPNDNFQQQGERDSDTEFYIINVDRVASNVSMRYRWSNQPQIMGETTKKVVQPYIKDQFIIDLILFIFFIGNDFLPHIDHIQIRTGGIDLLCQTYRKVIPYTGFLVDPISHQINQRAMYELMNELSKEEPRLLIDTALESRLIPNPALFDNIQRSFVSNRPSLDFEGFRRDYYKRIHVTDVEQMCEEYFRGMAFVIQYYIKNIPTYDWFYPYHYAPLFADLRDYAKKYDLTFHFDFKPALTLTEALFSVLPPSKYAILPVELQAKMNILSRTDPDFSETFQIDLAGKDRPQEGRENKGVVLLPTVTYDKIKRLLSEFSLVDPKGAIYRIEKKINPTQTVIRPKFYLTMSYKVYPRPGPGAAGVSLVYQSNRKIFDYGKFGEYVSEPEQIEYLALNDALNLFIRKVGAARRPGSMLVIRSDHPAFVESIRSEKVTNEEYRDLHKQTKVLIGYVEQNQYTVKYEPVDRERNIEAREVTEDSWSRQQDLYLSYIARPSVESQRRSSSPPRKTQHKSRSQTPRRKKKGSRRSRR